MKKKDKSKISIIGSGNVAWNIAFWCHNKGLSINQVYSRNRQKGKSITDQFGGSLVNQLSDLNPNSTVYIIAISDQAIKQIAENLKVPDDSILVHTSGSMGINTLGVSAKCYGSFYPLQTFTENTPVDFEKVNICIEGSDPYTEKKLMDFTKFFSGKISVLTSLQRKNLHLAAVFANNFVNYLLGISEDICNKNNVSYKLLQPLIDETLSKAQQNSPSEIQTGPAKRKDLTIIKEHLSIFTNKEYKEVYQLLTNQLIEKYHAKTKL